jgi:hypothetical protein
VATLAPNQLADALRAFLNRPNPLLFAGAGVGCRVGYPDWDAYIEHLAKAADEFRDSDSAVLIRKRLEQRNHLGAATVFKTSTMIPEGERWRVIAEPFTTPAGDDDLDKLVALVSLPFTAILTTNYEQSLHDACARSRGRWVTPIERNTLRGASLNREFFVARIHGSAVEPTSMVVDASDYSLLRQDSNYLDFLLHTLTSRSCLFVGFSFLDPAITHVLDLYESRFGPAYPRLHAALIPSGDYALANRLRHLNIETLLYSSADAHIELWRAIRQVHDTLPAHTTPTELTKLDATFGHGSIHRFLAFAYAQIRTRKDARPLAAISQDALVASLLAAHRDDFVTEPELSTEVARELRVTEAEALQIVTASLGRLAGRDQILRDGTQVAWVGSSESDLDTQLTRLARDVVDRASVREGIHPTDRDRNAAKFVLERILTARGESR